MPTTLLAPSPGISDLPMALNYMVNENKEMPLNFCKIIPNIKFCIELLLNSAFQLKNCGIRLSLKKPDKNLWLCEVFYTRYSLVF